MFIKVNDKLNILGDLVEGCPHGWGEASGLDI